MSIKRQAKVLQIKTGVEVQEGFTRDRKRDVVSTQMKTRQGEAYWELVL